jgi:hypothetical protein
VGVPTIQETLWLCLLSNGSMVFDHYNFEIYFPMGPILLCPAVPSTFSINIKKVKLCMGPSNDYSCTVWVQLNF